MLLGKDAHFIWPTHHLNYYNIDTLSNFLEIRNFEILEINTEGLDIFDYMWKEKNEDKTAMVLIKLQIRYLFYKCWRYGKFKSYCKKMKNYICIIPRGGSKSVKTRI